jgi:tetratricopeptide (TPR) repeat protein
VALKVLSAGLGLTSKAVPRFRREAEAAAKLHHTNIVPVYATGEERGTHFYAMELIDGPSLDHVIRELRQAAAGQTRRADGPQRPAESSEPADRQLALEAATTGPAVAEPGAAQALASSSLGSGSHYFDTVARMIADVAEALAHAHQNGVIHRDIKPSNLLLSAGGRLSVNDFGLARLLEQPGMTLTGEFVGTPRYMSPEQIGVGRVSVDGRTDIYSLGATLYELLTLEPPHKGQSRDQVLAQILQKEPKPPRKVNKKVPLDLETICLKALEKDPDRRYQTADRLAEDLRCHVNRFAISARRVGPVARVVKWAKRRPGMAAVLGCLAIAVLVAGFFGYHAQLAQDRLWFEQRQAALDLAMLEIMSGDIQAGMVAISDAESKGASPGQLNFLRGLAEHHGGNGKKAIDYLRKAVAQNPESVAAWALLAQVYKDDGQWQLWDETTAILEQRTPRTTEDLLFLGLAQTSQDPEKGIVTLDQALARPRQFPVARLMRAQAQTSLASATGKASDAEKALDDLRRVDLPFNPLLVSIRLNAHLAAATAYKREDPIKVDDFLQRAAEDADLLAKNPEISYAVLGRCSYFFYVEQDKTLLQVIRQAQQHLDLGILKLYEALAYYRQKEFEKAWSALRGGEKSGIDDVRQVYMGYVLATMPGRERDAEKACKDAIGAVGSGTGLTLPPTVLFLLGPKYLDKARQANQDVRDRFAKLIPNWRNRWYHDILGYNAGDLTAEQLLAKAGASQYNLCEGYFYIGLNKLAEGDRAKAKECFQRSAATGVIDYYEYMWSRAFLACIDDSDWLPGNPRKSEP